MSEETEKTTETKQDELNIITKDLWDMAVKEISNSDGWKHELLNDDIQIYSKMLFKEVDFPSYKMITNLPRPTELVFKSYVDHESRPKYLDNYALAKMVHKGYLLNLILVKTLI